MVLQWRIQKKQFTFPPPSQPVFFGGGEGRGSGKEQIWDVELPVSMCFTYEEGRQSNLEIKLAVKSKSKVVALQCTQQVRYGSDVIANCWALAKISQAHRRHVNTISHCRPGVAMEQPLKPS